MASQLRRILRADGAMQKKNSNNEGNQPGTMSSSNVISGSGAIVNEGRYGSGSCDGSGPGVGRSSSPLSETGARSCCETSLLQLRGSVF
jgi:hypothetical protein